MGMKKARAAIEQKFSESGGQGFKELVLRDWTAAEGMLQAWLDGLKRWEAKEEFKAAYEANRMTVRTFGVKFEDELHKSIKDFAVVGSHRFRPDSGYAGKFPPGKQLDHSTAFHKKDELDWYNKPVRGMDSSAFANPSNFMSRVAKYKAGLHDLSASLVNKDTNIFDQVHHQSDGAFFAFLPLPEMEDQALLYKLIRAAKELRSAESRFYETVRLLRASITRVKLAGEYDLGVGYMAVPVTNPKDGEPKYKLRYGLGEKTHPVEGETADAKLIASDKTNTMKLVNAETYQARQQAGINYKAILEKAARRTDGNKNEIVIAVRHHAGKFPVYAKRVGNSLVVMDLTKGSEVLTTQKLVLRGASN